MFSKLCKECDWYKKNPQNWINITGREYNCNNSNWIPDGYYDNHNMDKKCPSFKKTSKETNHET